MKKNALLTLFLSFSLFACLFQSAAYASNPSEVVATLTIDSQTDESCTGASDGSISYTISSINGTAMTVVLTPGSGILEQQDFNTI